MDQTDFVIIGGGLIGLATARALVAKRPGAKIILIDKEDRPGRHQTGRNSGVIHAGVYYKPGSLKARLCREGAAQTIRFCRQENIPFEQCGKMIVATDAAELGRLDELEKRARHNKLTLTRLDKAALKQAEPRISGISALKVAETGIVDYGQICHRLAERLGEAGVDIRLGERVTDIREYADAANVITSKSEIGCRTVIACAGLKSDRIAGMVGRAGDFRIIPFRGEYYRLSDTYKDVSRHLIYPVPDPAYPFLGVHLTRMIGGFVTVGPNAVLSLGYENYARNTPRLKDLSRIVSYPGFWKMIAANIGSGLHEMQGSLFKNIYLDRCRKYCPELKDTDLHPYPTGIRAQAVDRSGRMIEDFLIKETGKTVLICNAPSPAATSAFPIAEEITRRVMARL